MGRIYVDTGFRAGECATRARSESSAVNDTRTHPFRATPPPAAPIMLSASVRDA